MSMMNGPRYAFSVAAILSLSVGALIAGCARNDGVGTGSKASATYTHPAPKMTYPEESTSARTFPPGVDPALEALLPVAVDGVRLTRWSVPGASSGGGGDVCLLFCPGEPQYFGLALHLTTLEGTTVAVAAAANQPTFPVFFFAFKVPNANTEDLAQAWATGTYRAVVDPMGGNAPTRDPSAAPTPTEKPLQTEQATIGGKSVTILYDRFAALEGRAVQYLYARDDVLFIVEANQSGWNYSVDDPRNPPEAFVDSIAELP